MHERLAQRDHALASKQVPLTPKSSTSPEAISRSPSTAPQHEPSIPPTPPSPSGAHDVTPQEEQPPTAGEPGAEASGEAEEEGERAVEMEREEVMGRVGEREETMRS